ncbi:DUF6099 family protein [Streptomyces sp. NPDC012438]|uniref:DUF6099 family protein n=1 Tax=Streptomyces sp. NPDC012438 TaxID=3364833 RepID=UPI0036EE51C8
MIIRQTPPRPERLFEVRDVPAVLVGLEILLSEVSLALVGIAANTDDEGFYWKCLEGIDAVDEARDVVHRMRQSLQTWQPSNQPATH